VEAVGEHFQLHPLAVEDAVHAHQRAKLDTFGDSLLLVLKTARYVDHEELVEIGEILVFVGRTSSSPSATARAVRYTKCAWISKRTPTFSAWGRARCSMRSPTGWWTTMPP
jgi:hypothetical protein